MALKMSNEGKVYWLAKCKSAEDFYKGRDFSEAALRKFLQEQAADPPCYALEDIEAWEQFYHEYICCARALVFHFGEPVYKHHASRLLRCVGCRSYPECGAALIPENCVKTMTLIARDFRKVAKDL